MIEATEHVWLLEVPEQVLGICEDFDKAERILREHYLHDHGMTEESDGHRLLFNLKFGQWIFLVDKLPDWGYTATKIPRL